MKLFFIFFTLSLNHIQLIFAQNQENQKSLLHLNSTEQDHHRNGLPSQQTTYSATNAQFSNSGFVPIAKPLIAKLPERYDSTETDTSAEQTQPDSGSGAVLTRMGYSNNGDDYERVPTAYGLSTSYNTNFNSPTDYSDQSSVNLLRTMKQESIGSAAQDSNAQHVYDTPSMPERNAGYSEKYNNYLQQQMNSAIRNGNEYASGDSQPTSEGMASRQNFYKQLNTDAEVAKFLKSASSEANEEIASPEQTDSGESESEYGGDRAPQMSDFHQLNKDPKPSMYPNINDEQNMISAEMAQQLFKNYAQTQDMNSNALNENQMSNSGPNSDSDYQTLLNQLSMASQMSSQSAMPYNMPQKAQSELLSGLQQFSANNMQNMQQMGNYGSASQLNAQLPNGQALPFGGLQNFSPAQEGNQLPAPPGYKHVGYITIPAGTANVPNMMNSATAGLPIIRPMALMSSPQDSNRLPIGMTQKHLQSFHDQSKKSQEKQTSESKPRRTFLSRLNPLNMLRRLRQRRERRQTSDLSGQSSSNKNIYRMSNSGVYGMTSPIMRSEGYNSMSGLGGMSGMYGSMSGPQPVYAGMPGYGGAMSPYGGGYGYGGFPGGTGYAMVPTMYAQSGSGQGSGDATQSASNVMPSSSDANTQSMQMPMMMPMMGGMGGYQPMAMPSMPMGSMGGMGGMPYPMVPQQQQQSSQEEEEPQNNPNQLPGGLNLSDLLKDEEEEPSRFRKFMSYLNPINLFRRLRDRNATEDEDRKRFGRYRRHISDDLGGKSVLHFPQVSDESSPRASRVLFVKRSGRKSRMRFPRNEESDINAFNETNEEMNENNKKDDKLDSADSGLHPLSDHTSDESIGRSRNRYSFRRNRRPNQRTHFSSEGRHLGLMGSGNFEVLRGGTFRPEETTSSAPTGEDSSVYDSESSGNVFSALEDDIFDSGSPEVLGFQGFNGFGSVYNSLSASNKIPKLASIDKRRDRDLIGSIENAALTTTELKATS